MQGIDSEQKFKALKESSQEFIERVWRVGTEILEFYAPLNILFLSVFEKLLDGIIQDTVLSRMISELSLARFTVVPQYEEWIKEIGQRQREYFPSETSVVDLPLMLNLIFAKRGMANVAGRKGEPAPNRALSETQAYPRLEESSLESSERPIEAGDGQRVFGMIADFQARIEPKIASSTKALFSVHRQYGREMALLSASSIMPRYSLSKPAELEENLGPSEPLQEAKAIGPSPPEGRLAGLSASLPSPAQRTKSSSIKAFKSAAHLPEIAFKQETRALPNLEPAAYTFALSYLMTQLYKEVLPSLSSWIYGESEQLRGEGFSLSVVPIAASAAQNILFEALTQPIPPIERPKPSEESLSSSPVAQKPKAVSKDFEHFRLHELVAAALTAYGQDHKLGFSKSALENAYGAHEFWEVASSGFATYGRGYRLDLSEPALEQAYGTHNKTIQTIVQEQPLARGSSSEMKVFSKLPAVMALAAAEDLIVHKLRHGSAALLEDIRAARLSYGETLSEISAAVPMQTAALGEALSSQSAFSTIEPYVPQAPPIHGPLPRSSSISPTIQNTINVTVPIEAAEGDLRDLEAKMSRILADQMRRYYGSTRI